MRNKNTGCSDIVHVVHYQRNNDEFSVEQVFKDVRNALPSWIVSNVWRCRYRSRGVLPRAYDAVAAVRERGDVNHVTGDVHYLTYFLPRRATVLTVLDCICLDRTSGLRRWALWFLWYWLPVRRVAVITTISEASKDRLTAYIGSGFDVRVVHCPVSPRLLPHEKRNDHAPSRVLQIGTTPQKNIERLAEALSGLQVELRIVGRLTVSQTRALSRYRIRYTAVAGLTDEQVAAEYRDADIVTLVSTYEGFGLPIVEAQAVGRPVLTSNLMSMPEVAGDGACLVDPYDVSSIRAGMERILGNAVFREELVRAGFRNVRRFDAKIIAQQYAEIYAELASRVKPF